MSMFGEALREMLGEAELVCPECQEANSPTFRRIRIDMNGNTTCGSCGKGGDVDVFKQPPKEKTTS